MHMNCLIAILVIAAPFWVADMVINSLRLTVPFWVGDSLALLAAFAGALLLKKSFLGIPDGKAGIRRAFRNGDLGHTEPALTPIGGWERALPFLVHEIRNYSSTLRGNTMLLRRSLPPEMSLEPLSRLERTTEKIDHLARKILDAASLSGSLQTQSIDVFALIRDCIRDHFSDSGFYIGLEGGAEGRLQIEGEPMQLEIVFINLFRNALEAGARNVAVRLGRAGSRLCIRIEDDGGGCCKEELARLFQPLFTTKKAQGGTGLGLYLARSILDSHGGSIRAESKFPCRGNEKGMIFTLELPLKGKSGKKTSKAPFANSYLPTSPSQFLKNLK